MGRVFGFIAYCMNDNGRHFLTEKHAQSVDRLHRVTHSLVAFGVHLSSMQQCVRVTFVNPPTSDYLNLHC